MMTGEERQRTAPKDRFQGDSNLIDLNGVIEHLQNEHAPQHGRRQITVFKRGGLTQAVFLFEPGGELKNHQTPGQVVIQCFRGQVTVQTPSGAFHLSPGQLLALDPNVPHGLATESGAAVLVTVHAH